MKENSTFSNPCEHAAVRVQCWFGKDKENRLHVKNNGRKLYEEFSKKHKCDLLKPPRIPSQVEHLPLQGYVLTKKKKSKRRTVTKTNHGKPLRFAFDQVHCNVNQKNHNHLYPENPLSAQRVALCRLKEHFLVSKRLKSLSRQKPTGPKRHEVVPIKSTPAKDLSQIPYHQQWLTVKEERHFQIGRVIKYLTD